MNGPELRLLPKACVTRQSSVGAHAVAAPPAHAAALWPPASTPGTLSALFGPVLFGAVLFGKPLFGKLRIFRAEGRGARLAALAMLLATAPQTVGLAAPASSPALANPAPSPQQIDALAQIILATLRGPGANGRVSALAARLTFAIDQAQANCSTSLAALAQVLGQMQGQAGSLTPTARRALRTVRDNLSHCRTNGTGTAALRGNQSTLAQGTTLGLVGGTSNYQTSQ